MKSALSSAKFWFETLDRAVKTGAQDIIKVLTAAGVADIAGVDWKLALGFAGYGVVLSVLTSVASAPWSEPESPQLIPLPTA